MVGFAKQCNSVPNGENEDGLGDFAKAVFCLDQINRIILDQVFNKMQRYLLLFAKGPQSLAQDLQDYRWCHGSHISCDVRVFHKFCR